MTERKNFNCHECTPEEYFCTECSFSTHLEAYFKQHLREYHSLKQENEDTKLVIRTYTCSECPFWTYSELVLLKHQIHWMHTTGKRKDKITGVFEDGIKWYICHHCNHRNKHLTHLKSHILYKHTPSGCIQWFRCNECNYKAKVRENLKYHIKTHHTSPEHLTWLKCDQCEYKCKTSTCMYSHKRNKHTPIEKKETLKCNHCEYVTINMHRLNMHILYRHTPDEHIKWLVCAHCEYKCKTQTGMYKHLRNKSERGRHPAFKKKKTSMKVKIENVQE